MQDLAIGERDAVVAPVELAIVLEAGHRADDDQRQHRRVGQEAVDQMCWVRSRGYAQAGAIAWLHAIAPRSSLRV